MLLPERSTADHGIPGLTQAGPVSRSPLTSLALVASFVSLILNMVLAINLYEVSATYTEAMMVLSHQQDRQAVDIFTVEQGLVTSEAMCTDTRDWLRRISLASRIGWMEARAVTMSLTLHEEEKRP